jgi:hypothetical protein
MSGERKREERMVKSLSPPRIVRTYLDDAFDSFIPAMYLQWEENDERIWELPADVRLSGPAPERFGVRIRRHNTDGYTVRLLWDRTYLHWPTVTRRELMTSALAPLLASIGTDLWYLLDQPIAVESNGPHEAA